MADRLVFRKQGLKFSRLLVWNVYKPKIMSCWNLYNIRLLRKYFPFFFYFLVKIVDHCGYSRFDLGFFCINYFIIESVFTDKTRNSNMKLNFTVAVTLQK